MPKINYSIRYTERTWGYDLAELIKSNLKSDIVHQPYLMNTRKLLLKFLLPIFIIAYVALFIESSKAILTIRIGSLLNNLDSFLGSTVEIESKLDYLLRLVHLVASRSLFLSVGDYYIIYMLFSMIIIAIILVLSWFFMFYLISPSVYKFILFTDHSRKEKNKILRRDTKYTIISIIGLLMNIVYGIVANYIFKILTQ